MNEFSVLLYTVFEGAEKGNAVLKVVVSKMETAVTRPSGIRRLMV